MKRPSYDEIYLRDIQENLANIIELSVNLFKMKIGDTYEMFLNSHYSKDFETAVPYVLCERTGPEMLFDILNLTDGEIDLYREKLYSREYSAEDSAEYWTGWALAWYQWQSGFTFREINERVPIEKVRALCENVRGGKDLPRFKEAMDAATGV